MIWVPFDPFWIPSLRPPRNSLSRIVIPDGSLVRSGSQTRPSGQPLHPASQSRWTLFAKRMFARASSPVRRVTWPGMSELRTVMFWVRLSENIASEIVTPSMTRFDAGLKLSAIVTSAPCAASSLIGSGCSPPSKMP